MKLAILIVGEYRSFAHCRKTMLFLDQNNIDKDIYINTWNVTNTRNPKTWENGGTIAELIPPIYKNISIQEINKDIGIYTTQISIIDKINNGFPNLVNGWIYGFELIQKSKIHYDYVLVLRPDLFFENSEISNSYFKSYRPFENYTKGVGFRPPYKKNYLDDTIFFSTYENMEKILSYRLIDSIKLNYYETVKFLNNEWHEFWYDYIVNENKLCLLPLPIDTKTVIARYPIIESSTFDDMWKQYWDYWDPIHTN